MIVRADLKIAIKGERGNRESAPGARGKRVRLVDTQRGFGYIH
jgi:hypothetical protein